MREAISLDERSGGDRVHHVFSLYSYAFQLRSRGDLAEARKVCSAAQAEATQLRNPSAQIGADFECARIALDQGDVAAAATMFARVRKTAEEIGDATGSADGAVGLARIEMAKADWPKALALLDTAAAKYHSSEDLAGEGTALALAALANCAAGATDACQRATADARALRTRATTRQNVFGIDIALARLSGKSAAESSSALLALAADAERRQWLAQALEARFAAWQVLERAQDPAAARLRDDIAARARQHGFAWLRSRVLPAGR
jgi:hypothetical protein